MEYITNFESRKIKILYYPSEGGDLRGVTFRKLNENATNEQIGSFAETFLNLIDGQFGDISVTRVDGGGFNFDE